jgi:hypothetical protein
MIRFWPTVAIAAAVLFRAALASAQIQLVPAATPRWDTAAQIGWTSLDSGYTNVSGRRYNAAALTGSAGFLVTRHLKVSFGTSYAAQAEEYSTNVERVPGTNQQIYTYTQDRFQSTIFSPSVGYQFFENRWVHPTIAAGVQVARETHRLETEGPYTGNRRPETVSSTFHETHVRPFVSAGLKFYTAERVFIQTGVDLTFAERGDRRVTWASGVGFDF